MRADTTAEEYAQIANAIWSVANVTGKLHMVQHDNLADVVDLNEWYDKDGRQFRWHR